MLTKAPSASCPREETPARRARDLRDETAILQVMEAYNLGAENLSCTVISNVATKDIATPNISDALLSAKQRGVELVQEFVRQRLIKGQETGKFLVSYHAPIHKNRALTLADLF